MLVVLQLRPRASYLRFDAFLIGGRADIDLRNTVGVPVRAPANQNAKEMMRSGVGRN